MTLYELQQRMGSDATDAEAEAMAHILRERFAIDITLIGVDEPDLGETLTDEEFFRLIPLAIERAETDAL